MKTKRIIIATLSVAIITIALRKLMTGEFDWRSVITDLFAALLFSLFFFTLGMKFLHKIAKKAMNSVPTVELTDDERLLLESPASHIKGPEAVGGKLFLTDKRLVFKSHKLNVQNHQEELSLNQIITVVQGEGKFERVVQVTSANNDIERFVVESPSRWIQMLRRQLNMI